MCLGEIFTSCNANANYNLLQSFELFNTHYLNSGSGFQMQKYNYWEIGWLRESEHMSQHYEKYIQSIVTAVVNMVQSQISLLYLKSDSVSSWHLENIVYVSRT